MSAISTMRVRESCRIKPKSNQLQITGQSAQNYCSYKSKLSTLSKHCKTIPEGALAAHSPTIFSTERSLNQQLTAKQTSTLALRMGLSSAKIPRSHGIALLRLTLFFSSILLVLCLHTEMVANSQLVHDCKSTPSLRNGNPQFLVNEVRKFVDNCIKTKDGIRFRKRFPTPSRLEMNGDFGEYGSGTDSETLPIEMISGSSTTPLPGSQKKNAGSPAKERLAAFIPPPPPVLMFNEKPFGAIRFDSPSQMLMAAYFRDLARRERQTQQSIQDWNANMLSEDE